MRDTKSNKTRVYFGQKEEQGCKANDAWLQDRTVAGPSLTFSPLSPATRAKWFLLLLTLQTQFMGTDGDLKTKQGPGAVAHMPISTLGAEAGG